MQPDRVLHITRQAGTILLAAVLLIAGLGAPLTLAAPASQADNVLRIGYLGTADTQTANGAQLAISQINSVGGVRAADGTTYRLELLTLSETPIAGTLAAAAEGYASQGVRVLLGPDQTIAFSPDNIQQLDQIGLPVLTSATGDALTELDGANVLFRLRAPERVYSYALATYMAEDLGLSSVAVIQTDVDSTEAVIAFESALDAAGIPLADRIQVPGGAVLSEQAQRLIDLNPDAIAMWGPYADAAEILRLLRDAGWQGRFAFRYAQEAVRAGTLPVSLANGVIGVSSWSYAYEGRASRIFLRDYVVAFGEVPGPLAVAAYDGIWFLRAAIISQGVEADALRGALLGSSPQTLVQGALHPIEFENGDLARLAVVYEMGLRGGAIVRARFDDAARLPLEESGTPVAGGATPTPTTNPNVTIFPTPTLEGVWVQVTANALNVRTGPGFNYDKIGQVDSGDLLRVLGAIADYSWLAVDFSGGVGWVKTEYTDLLGDLSMVGIIQAPPTPTLAYTPTPSLAPFPDIVIDTVVLSPANPIPNQPFTATVNIRNAGGGAAGHFAVAATFEPGGVYTSASIEGLAGGQTTQAQLTGTLTGTGAHTVAVVADLNKEVAESNEDNNLYNVTYRADYPLFANQTGVQLNATTQWDLYGGTPDLVWDGYNIGMLNGSQIGIIGGQTYENVTFDMLTPGVVSNTVGYGTDQVLSGMVYGFYVAEGLRGVVRVDNRQGETIWISYRVYNHTP